MLLARAEQAESDAEGLRQRAARIAAHASFLLGRAEAKQAEFKKLRRAALAIRPRQRRPAQIEGSE